MNNLKITRQNRYEIVIGNEDNCTWIKLPFDTWSTNEEEQKKLESDPRNVYTRELAEQILKINDLKTHEIGLKNKPTKKYFTVTDNETTLGVFEYTNNHDADSLIMQIVCEHLNADDCVTNQGFYVEDYKHKPYKITGTHWEELSDKYEFEIFIEQVHLYTK